MKTQNETKAKLYVCEFPDSKYPPRIVRGWPAVLKIRKSTKGRMVFKGFHTYERAEEYLIEKMRSK